MTHYEELAKHLTERSEEICADNECTEDEHNCDSYAYMQVTSRGCIDGKERIDAMLLTVCCSDYFQGSAKEYIALPLPFTGDAKALKAAVEEEWLSLA